MKKIIVLILLLLSFGCEPIQEYEKLEEITHEEISHKIECPICIEGYEEVCYKNVTVEKFEIELYNWDEDCCEDVCYYELYYCGEGCEIANNKLEYLTCKSICRTESKSDLELFELFMDAGCITGPSIKKWNETYCTDVMLVKHLE